MPQSRLEAIVTPHIIQPTVEFLKREEPTRLHKNARLGILESEMMLSHSRLPIFPLSKSRVALVQEVV